MVQQDEHFLRQLPYLFWACESLWKAKHDDLVAFTNTLSTYRQKYEEAAFSALGKEAARLPAAKEAALKALHRVATIALTYGFTAKDFETLVTENRLRYDPVAWVSDLVKLIRRPDRGDRKFTCIVAVHGAVRPLQIIARKAGFEFLRHTRTPALLLEAAPDATFLSFSAAGTSASEALRVALRHLRPALDIYNFYSRSRALSLHNEAVVSDSERSLTLSIDDQSLRKLPARKDPYRLTKNALNAIPPELLAGRVLNALEHYSLAETSAAARVKLVNLWSALECISPGPSDRLIVDRVCDCVVPIVVWRRVDKITRYVATALTNYRESGFCAEFGDGFKESNRSDHVFAEEVLLTLCRPKDHPHITGLLAAVSKHPLLLSRVYNLWQTFSDPRALSEQTVTSRQRTVWQLHRIYRARNLIVHHGEQVPTANQLLDNLRYYCSLTLSRILHGMNSHPGWTVEDSTTHWRARSTFVIDMLREQPQQLVIRNFFPAPQRHLDVAVWSHLATPSPKTPTSGTTTATTPSSP